MITIEEAGKRSWCSYTSAAKDRFPTKKSTQSNKCSVLCRASPPSGCQTCNEFSISNKIIFRDKIMEPGSHFKSFRRKSEVRDFVVHMRNFGKYFCICSQIFTNVARGFHARTFEFTLKSTLGKHPQRALSGLHSEINPLRSTVRESN